MRPSRRTLYLLASLLWIVAGANVLRIGLSAWLDWGHSSLGSLLYLVGSLGFFSLLIFPRVAQRNISYISSHPAPRPWHCMSPKAWVIMLVMISLGISLRLLGLVPVDFIAGFYTGLGTSLMLATYPYLHQYKQG